MKKAAKLFVVFFAVLGLLVSAAVIKAPAVSAADLTGTWELAVDTPSGKGYPTFVLKQDGNNITGTYKGTFGESKVTGTATGDTFKMSFMTSGTTIVYAGKLDGNKMSGTVTFGDAGEGSFTGEKK